METVTGSQMTKEYVRDASCHHSSSVYMLNSSSGKHLMGTRVRFQLEVKLTQPQGAAGDTTFIARTVSDRWGVQTVSQCQED